MNKKITLGLWGVLLAEYLFIFLFLLNYDLAWMNPEKFAVHQWILSNGPHWESTDWSKFLHIDVIELNADRLSRPLSNLIEVIDTKWRASLWDIIPPHPSLSLQWPLMFILLPWLLWRTFVNMGCFSFVALMGVCVYIASVGFLGPLVMLFHPAKNLVNFFGVLAMYFFSLGVKPSPHLHKGGGRGVLWAGFLSLFLGFLSDETGVYLYVMAIVLFHRLWLQLWHDRRYGLLVALFMLPLVYGVTIKFFMPYVHWAVRGVWVHFNNYECYPSFKSLFWPNWNLFWQNTKFLFADHPHLLINYGQLSAYPLLLGVQIMYVAVVLLMIFLFFKALPHSDRQQSIFLVLMAAGILLMIGYCFFQTFQLSQNAKVWGIWYYGSLFSLIYIFSLVFFLQFVFSHYQWLGRWSVILVLVFVLNGLVFSTYRIAAFKHQNLNRAGYSFVSIFKGTVDPYQLYSFHGVLERNACKAMYTRLYWRHWKNLPEDVDPGQKEKCYSGVLAADFYFMTEENMYLPSELHSDVIPVEAGI